MHEPNWTSRRCSSRREEEGCVDLTAFNELVASFDMDEDAVDALMQMLHERGIDVRDDCGRESAAATYVARASSRPRRPTRSSCSSTRRAATRC